MNLYLIILKNEKKYYVVADDCHEALKKLNDYYENYICCIDEFNIFEEWQEIKNIANNWQDLKIGVFE